MKELEFESKLQSFVDGNLDDEDCQEVVARLKADPEAFKKHCDYAALDAGLHHLIVEAAILNSEQEPIEEFTRSARSKKTRFVALLTACAAMVVGHLLKNHPGHPPGGPVQSHSGCSIPHIAQPFKEKRYSKG